MLFASPVLAQQTTQEPSNPPAAMEVPQTAPDAGANADAQTTGPKEASQTAELDGMQVWSSDEQNLGTVEQVNLDPNGQAESIHVNVGAVLGIGGKTVKIDAADFAAKDDRVELTLSEEEVSALPEVAAE